MIAHATPKRGKDGIFFLPPLFLKSLHRSVTTQSKQLPSAKTVFSLQEGEGVWKALSGEDSAAEQDVLMKEN